ncbi:CoA ester lyase [Spiribacter halobius]|uniref:CoA ester lyase n=2 Tax=Sediminicurvatus halobius TaxID=2182432 RepID=A0A2U2N9X1_9GAMM|nr:CoA ester lyase [Spiribacter halobius]
MSTTARPRRSVLYMPGSNARALDKGRTLAADALILDLEDAVSPEAKTDARDQVLAAVAAGGYGHREVAIRVNGLDTPWGHADLAAVAGSGADAAVLPKVESADAVRRADAVLRAAGAPEDLAIWCMIETPRGVLHAEEIADAHPRLAVLVMGTSDLAKDLHCAHTQMRLPLLHSLSRCLLAARAAGLAIVDGVHLDLNDEAGFRRACEDGLALGFDGKTLIHPKTIATANEVFAPDADTVAWSRRVIEAHEAAARRGEGVVLLDGKLIENLHVEDAHRIVALAEAIERRGE